MLRHTLSLRTAFLRGCVLPIALAACGDSDNPLHPDNSDLAALRQAVEPFRDIHAAQQAGYNVIVAHPTSHDSCLQDPDLGAMGVHFLDATLVDDTVLVTVPEVMIYEPQADGSESFVAVEYIVPFSIRGEDQPPPVLFGQEFMQDHTFDLWMLHVWVGKDNPSGVFAPWNPDVTCEFAHAVGA